MSNYKHKNKKGFTLIETIVAMTIVMISVTVLSQVYFTAMKTSSTNKQRLEALVLAQNQLEEIRAQRDINTFNNTASFQTWLVTSGFSNQTTHFQKIQTIAAFNYDTRVYIDQTMSPLLQVVVTVKPRDANMVQIGTKFLVQ